MVFQKVDLGGSKLTCPTLLLLDQSSPDVFFAERGRNRGRLNVFPILDISICFGDTGDRSLKLSEVDPNFARFGPHFLVEGRQNFATEIIKPN